MVIRVGAALLMAMAASSVATQRADWNDSSPHRVRMIPVDRDVNSEVLDWGGTNRPLFVLGCYLTGHAFDDIAPKLVDRFQFTRSRDEALVRRGVRRRGTTSGRASRRSA